MNRIPFNKPTLMGNELNYIYQAIDCGHISGDGQFTKKCNSYLEEILEVAKVLLTTSCTHALEMAAILLDIRPGDEAILPSFTFVSTVNAFVLRGAIPVFADIKSDTLNINEQQIEGLISSKTRVIVPVHYAGVGCEMDAIMEIANRNGLAVVEDNAHGLFGKYKNRYLGTFGSLATQSFHETKNISCGEGGALLINDPELIERGEIIREKGTNRSRFFRGQVDKYTWVDIGSSYLPSDMLAAYLYAQLEVWQKIQEKRKLIWETYHVALKDWALANGVGQPHVPPHCEQAYHMYYLIMPSLEIRQRFISQMKNKGILSVFHYLPLHVSEMGKRFGGKLGDCPVTEEISEKIVRLPFYCGLVQEEQSYIIEKVMEFVP